MPGALFHVQNELHNDAGELLRRYQGYYAWDAETGMIEQLAGFIVDESNWLPASMTLALAAVTTLLFRHQYSRLPARRQVLAAMNLFFGLTIAIMALGHFLAVTVKLASGSLEGSPLILYVIGVVLAIPSWWLVFHAWRMFVASGQPGRATVLLNVWLAITLLALGLHNLPLAAPALFNAGYRLHSRSIVGWVIVVLTVVFYVTLFIGSLIFLASGQSFEEFTGA